MSYLRSDVAQLITLLGAANTPNSSLDHYINSVKFLLDSGITAGNLPDPTGNSGKFVTTDGSTVSYGLVSEASLSFSDILTNNVSTSKHGLVPKLPNDSSKFLNGVGAWVVPPSGSGTLYSSLGSATDGAITQKATSDSIYQASSIGDLYNEDFSGGSLTNYTNTGSASASISGGTLNISGGTANNTANVITRNLKTCFDQSYRIVRFKVTANATGETIGIGYAPKNSLSFPHCVYVTFNTSASTNRGQIKIHAISSNAATDVALATSNSNISYTNGDIIEMRIDWSNPGTIEAKTKNITTGSDTVFISYTSANLYVTTPVGANAIYTSAIYAMGATFSVLLDVLGTKQKYGPTLVRLGDSITAGAFIGSSNQREVDCIRSQTSGLTETFACGGNTALDVFNSLSYVIQMKPKYAAIMVGINDLLNGITLGTTTTPGTYLYNYQQILTTLVSNGIIPIILTILPVSSTVGANSTINTWNAALVSNFGNSYQIIDYNTQLLSSGNLRTDCDSGDGLHINALGHAIIGNYFIANATQIRSVKQFGLWPNLFYDGSILKLGETVSSPGITVTTGFSGYTALPAGAIISGSNLGGLSLLSGPNGTTGHKVIGAYYVADIVTYKSAFEFANVATGTGVLTLMKDGGTVKVSPLAGNGSGIVGVDNLGNLSFSSALGGVTIQNISSSTTLNTASNKIYTVFIDATAGNVVVTLPAGNTSTIHIIRRTDSTTNTVTFSGTINGFGVSGTSLSAGGGFIMTYDGSNFYCN